VDGRRIGSTDDQPKGRGGQDVIGYDQVGKKSYSDDMPYGVREYAARDPEDGLWSFMTTLETDGIADAPTEQ